jgi:hypothetical protein
MRESPQAKAGIPGRVREVAGAAPDGLCLDALVEAQQPVVFKGLAADWPLVARGHESAPAAIDYLKSFDSGRPVVGYTGSPDIGGRFFYNEDLTGLNFEAGRVPLGQFLDRIAAHLDDSDPPSFYIGSTDLDLYLPGLRAENDLGLDPASFGPAPPLVSIWIGNRTIASAHYDMSNNLACCMVGGGDSCSSRPTRCTISIPGLSSRHPAAKWSAWSTFAPPISKPIRASPTLLPPPRWPSSSLATCSSIPLCGGIMSRRSTASTR